MSNITFIIGNGFDINLGMATKYSDIYKSYIETPSFNENIKQFKRSLSSDYKLWSDFEIGMAKYASRFGSEQDFIECIRDFKGHMVAYLLKEQSTFEKPQLENKYVQLTYARFIEQSLISFADGCFPNAKRKMDLFLKERPTYYNIITLNYTTILDNMIDVYNKNLFNSKQLYSISRPIHLHGKLGEDIVLGTDNEDQILHSFGLTRSGRRAFIKPFVNREYDQYRVDTAKEVIENSNVICIYGMSFGESDLTWTTQIINWLLSSKDHHLIYNYYDSQQYPLYNQDFLLDLEDSRKYEILKKTKLTDEQIDKIYSQVHISIMKNIFNKKELEQEISKAVTKVPVFV